MNPARLSMEAHPAGLFYEGMMENKIKRYFVRLWNALQNKDTVFMYAEDIAASKANWDSGTCKITFE